jgi:intracellular septation protein
MKFLFDFFPILLFFIVYKLYGIYAATAVAIAAAIVQNAFYYLKHKKFETMHLITLAVIIVLGGMTLIFQNKAFIMWKPTAVYWAIALAFLISQWVYKKPLIKKMMSKAIEVPEDVWNKANYGMALFSVFLGFANLYVANFYFKAENLLLAKSSLKLNLDSCATYYSGELIQLCEYARDMEEQWVNFKLFGMLGLSLILMIILVVYLSINATNKDENGNLTSLDND